MNPSSLLVAFDGPHRIATGSLSETARQVSAYLLGNPYAQPLIFDTETGRQVDLDLREVVPTDATTDSPKSKGRPKLGVVAKEVTLLPRHWDWLASQPGGASVTLRKLIERASKDPAPKELQQARATAAYHFMHAVAGNLPGFEEASRLLFAGNIDGLSAAVSAWPGDIGEQVLALARVESLVTPA
ncbi:MAG: DUF2239 family protein [Pseudomonadota bacterium]